MSAISTRLTADWWPPVTRRKNLARLRGFGRREELPVQSCRWRKISPRQELQQQHPDTIGRAFIRWCSSAIHTFSISKPKNALSAQSSSCEAGEATYLGGRDVESSNCRSDSTLRLHFVRNSPLASLVARGKRGVVRGQRLSGDWSSPHSRKRCGRSSQGTSARVSARVLR